MGREWGDGPVRSRARWAAARYRAAGKRGVEHTRSGCAAAIVVAAVALFLLGAWAIVDTQNLPPVALAFVCLGSGVLMLRWSGSRSVRRRDRRTGRRGS